MAFEDAIGKLVLEVIRNAALKEALDAAQESDEPVVREIELGRLRPRKLLVRVSRLPGRTSDGSSGPRSLRRRARRPPGSAAAARARR